MRVIAGALKGRRLGSPTWSGLRPSSDRLRETLFNIIRERVPDARVLDGFAGTGAVGIEALSRGAAHVVFMERDPRARRLISANLARCGLSEGYTILRADVGEALRRDPTLYDLVLLDPPYDAPELEDLVSTALARLRPSGLLVLEHAAKRAAPAVDVARVTRTVRVGDSALAFYERPAG